MTGLHELSVERVIDAPVDIVWRAWTEHFEEWWAPRPWTTQVVRQELRAGGPSEIEMYGLDDEGGPLSGIFLEVTPHRRIVFTNAIDPEWRPQSPAPLSVVIIFDFADAGDGRTLYRGTARHWTGEAKDVHAAMGFATGWNIAIDQLAEVAVRLKDMADA